MHLAQSECADVRPGRCGGSSSSPGTSLELSLRAGCGVGMSWLRAFAVICISGSALVGVLRAEGEVIAIGSATVTAPADWKAAVRRDDRLVFRSGDDHQQATIALLRLGSEPSFDEFKSLCTKRVDAERGQMARGFVQDDPPFRDGESFGMFFSGGDKDSRRVFSGYLSIVGRELITVYVEGIGVQPKDHLEAFQQFVRALKR